MKSCIKIGNWQAASDKDWQIVKFRKDAARILKLCKEALEKPVTFDLFEFIKDQVIARDLIAKYFSIPNVEQFSAAAKQIIDLLSVEEGTGDSENKEIFSSLDPASLNEVIFFSILDKSAISE